MVKRGKADASLHDKGVAVLRMISPKLAVASEVSVQRAFNPQGKGWAQTRNVAIEIAHATDSSPLMTTNAEFVVVMLLCGEVCEKPLDVQHIWVFDRPSFVEKVREQDRYLWVRGGDGGQATLALVPVEVFKRAFDKNGLEGHELRFRDVAQTTIQA